MDTGRGEIDDLLAFWFGEDADDGAVARRKGRLWWGHDPEADATIRRRFSHLVRRAARGELDHWTSAPRGRLGLILLCDQLPRSVYRGSAAAFATDAKALGLTREGLRLGLDRDLRPIEAVFLLMPLQHAEDLAAQEEAVTRFRALADRATDLSRPVFDEFLDFAVRHRDIVAAFGRFPHRNQVLGRPSTTEELDFLARPGSSF